MIENEYKNLVKKNHRAHKVFLSVRQLRDNNSSGPNRAARSRPAYGNFDSIAPPIETGPTRKVALPNRSTNRCVTSADLYSRNETRSITCKHSPFYTAPPSFSTAYCLLVLFLARLLPDVDPAGRYTRSPKTSRSICVASFTRSMNGRRPLSIEGLNDTTKTNLFCEKVEEIDKYLIFLSLRKSIGLARK